MNKTEWLRELRQELDRLGIAHGREILADYEEHFSVAAERGQSEDVVTGKLGSPLAVARAHRAEALVTKIEQGSGWDFSNAIGAALRLLVLTPFNFFMLVGPFLVLSVLLVFGWFLCLLGTALSVGALGVSAVALPFLIVNFWAAGAFFFAALTFAGLTVLSVLLMFLFSKVTIRIFVSYLRWNIDFVIDRKGNA